MNARSSRSRSVSGRPAAPTGPAGAGERLVIWGVIVATFGVAVAMLPGGYSPFGPIKALVLLCGAACVAAGFAREPALARGALARVAAQRAAWPALALVGLAVLASFTSIDPSQSLLGHYPEYQGLLLLLCAAFVALGAYSLAEKDGAWRAIGRAACVALLLVAAYGLLQFANLDPVAYERAMVVRRVRSTLGNASNLGVFLCLVLPLALARARSESGAWRWVAWAGPVAGALTLALSLSRGAWVGALAGALAWLLWEGRDWDGRARLQAAAIALAAAVAALALTAALVPNAAGRLGALLDPTTGTAGWRTEVWTATTRLTAERPLLGFGPATFRYAFPPRRTASMMAGETGVQALDDPHNLFASAAVSAGVFALLALAWLLAETAVAAWRLPRDDGEPLAGAALLAALAAGVVALQFHFATLDSAPLLAIVIALALGRTPVPAPAASAAGLRATRVSAAVLAAAFAACALLAAGLVVADRQIASGYAAVNAGRPWAQARDPFVVATRLAPWEPATRWALGRGASLALSSGTGADAFSDAAAAMSAANAALPLDPLVAAQYGDVYLVAGVKAHDAAKLEQALPLIDRSIALDPQNGYRWAARGMALAGLGRLAESVADLERAVQYAPNDTAAWAALATIYERTGQPQKAATARQRSAASQ
jgi:hypothetical protein